MKNCGCYNENSIPEKLTFNIVDYFKVMFSWFRAFHKTFRIEPGLYYIGESYDVSSPLLTTCNYHMTVFLLWRKLKNRNVRILVIDTKGINVWCSSGKGQFSAEEILRQLNKYPVNILTNDSELEIILPKLSLSGVKLSILKKYSIKPIIGPIYINDIPEFLDIIPRKNRTEDKYKFKLTDRFFTLIPSLVQMIYYSIFIFTGLFLFHQVFKTEIWWQLIPLMFSSVILYIIIFPLLPSKNLQSKEYIYQFCNCLSCRYQAAVNLIFFR